VQSKQIPLPAYGLEYMPLPQVTQEDFRSPLSALPDPKLPAGHYIGKADPGGQ